MRQTVELRLSKGELAFIQEAVELRLRDITRHLNSLYPQFERDIEDVWDNDPILQKIQAQMDELKRRDNDE